MKIYNNILKVSNNIHLDPSNFRIQTKKDGSQFLQKNGSISSLFYRGEDHRRSLEALIQNEIKILSSLPEDAFITTDGSLTDLAIAAHKFNHALSKNRETGLAKWMDLKSIKGIPEIAAAHLTSMEKLERSSVDISDIPTVQIERRLGIKHKIKRYPGDNLNHSKEAGRIFINTQLERIGSIFSKNCRYFLSRKKESEIYSKDLPISTDEAPTSFWLGHASLLLSVPLRSKDGKSVSKFSVITDPIEGDMQKLLYRRQTRFARPMKQLPAPDVYLLSHNHLDHYDAATIKKLLSQQPVMIVPVGDGKRFRKMGFKNIQELDWWESSELKFKRDGKDYEMKITAVPSRHWSGQGPCKGHESTFLGYVIQGMKGGDLYFAGDTAQLNEAHVEKLRDRFNIKWNFQPGGPDSVRKDMKSTHQASADALWMHFEAMVKKIDRTNLTKEAFIQKALNLRTVYMHTMTFKLGNLHFSDTQDSVEKVLKALQYKDVKALKDYEKEVYDKLLKYEGLQLTDGLLSHSDIAELLRKTVIIPKIGSRLDLTAAKDSQLEKLVF